MRDYSTTGELLLLPQEQLQDLSIVSLSAAAAAAVDLAAAIRRHALKTLIGRLDGEFAST